MLLLPMSLVLRWGEIPQRAVDWRVHIHVIREAPGPLPLVLIVSALRHVRLIQRITRPARPDRGTE